MNVLPLLEHLRAHRQKGFAVLVDPDKLDAARVEALAQRVQDGGVRMVLVGGSLLLDDHIHQLIPALKARLQVPVVLFPGNVLQVSPHADALLFLSLISGRNPEMLIGNHVLAAPLLRQSGLEVIPTGYMLVDTGRATAVNYMSQTMPLPWDKPDLAAVTALAGQYLGLRVLYMDGGSGAEKTISPEMIARVSSMTQIPLIVGGGIRSGAQARALFEAGADLLVIGNALESGENSQLWSEIRSLSTPV